MTGGGLSPAAAVDAAQARLAEAPDGDLPLGARELVWAALGPLDGEGQPPGPGHRRRAALALRVCEHVLGLWERERPEDRLPHRALDTARRVVDGSADPDSARAEAGRLWGHTENLTQLLGAVAQLSVGFACAKAVEVALSDEYFDPADLDPDRAGLDLDLFEVDTAFVAAMAWAGGPPWIEGTDTGARRAFWEWWLREVPRAADAVRADR